MRTIIEFFLAVFLRASLWFRYRITVKGLDKLNENTLKRPGGVLFLPNHPSVFVDATAITTALWPKFRLRPMIVEYMYQLPVVNGVMKFLNALPVPDFSTSSNSLKKKKNEQVTQAVITGLKNGENFLIFPAGRCKQTSYEALDGASATHRIIQETPEANVVLVRVKGLWGSSFSRALIGRTPPFFPTVINGMKHVLKNLLFFTPRRNVIIEFEPAPPNFPYNAGKLEFNKYLEQFYNKPDGLRPQTDSYPGDSLILVSYSMWKEEYPQVWQAKGKEAEEYQLSMIPPAVQNKVIAKISELTSVDPKSISPGMLLTTDLGMDSLDIAEMAAFLQDEYDISGATSEDLSTVGRVMALASQQIKVEEGYQEEEQDISKWKEARLKVRVEIDKGKTMAEVFLNSCDRWKNLPAIGDMRSGVVTYSQLKVRALVLAEYIKTVPGKYVGIMLPSSVAATICIFACQLAGKTPVMVNWTVGPRHLQAVKELSKVNTVLSSWAFLDRLQNVDLTGIEDQLVMLEDLKGKIGLSNKLKSWLLSKKNTATIMKVLEIDTVSPDDEAVLLFTSGTESMPKGVPLSHKNILTNQRASLEAIELFSNDVIFGILPPFHSFGFTISSTIGVLSGVRVAYSPDPTEGKRLAQAFERWGVTIMCGAPTFVKAMIKAAKPEQLHTMRLCITGAEKLPPELVQSLVQLGKGEGLLEGYGITECAPVLTFTPLGKLRKGVGQAIPGVALKIVDLNTHVPLSTGQQGLILVKGPNVFSRYLNPGLKSPFLSVEGVDWYNTGDLGFLDDEGNLTLSGRLKRFVKVGGEMVSLASIEDALGQAALAKGWSSNKEEAPVLAITAKEIAGERPKINLFTRFNISLDEINKTLREAGFSNLVKVTNVTELPEIPIMGTGKINYRKLDEMS